MKFKLANTYTIQCMGQGISLISKGNNLWSKPWFNILLHTQSIVCATVKGQCLEFLVSIRWVSVVEFLDPTLGLGKVLGQESTVVKWNYQILGLHPVAVRQKLGVILVIKWFKNWSKEKMLFTKKVRLNWYSSMIFFFERFGWFLT